MSSFGPSPSSSSSLKAVSGLFGLTLARGLRAGGMVGCSAEGRPGLVVGGGGGWSGVGWVLLSGCVVKLDKMVL